LTVGAHVPSHKTNTKRFQNLCGEMKGSDELNLRYCNCNTTVLKKNDQNFDSDREHYEVKCMITLHYLCYTTSL